MPSRKEKDLINIIFVDSEKIEMTQQASSFTVLFIDKKASANHSQTIPISTAYASMLTDQGSRKFLLQHNEWLGVKSV